MSTSADQPSKAAAESDWREHIHQMLADQELSSRGHKHHDAVLAVNDLLARFLKRDHSGSPMLARADWRACLMTVRRLTAGLKSISKAAMEVYLENINRAVLSAIESKPPQGEGHGTK